MQILFATSEAVPFAKTGGLADVCGACRSRLRGMGTSRRSSCRRFARLARRASRSNHGRPVRHSDRQQDRSPGTFCRASCRAARCRCTWSSRTSTSTARAVSARTARTTRTTASGSCSSAGPCWRRFACSICRSTCMHCHDWQTGLIPAYLKIEYRGVPRLRADRHAVHDPQPGLPGQLLALGHAADRARTGSTSTGGRWSSTAT